MLSIKCGLIDLYISLKRFILSLVLLIAGTKITYLFLEVALTALFVKTRNEGVDIDMVKFFRLVQNDYDEDIVALPYHNVNLIWSNEFLDSSKTFRDGEYTIREVINNNELLENNLERVIDSMLVNLPKLIKFRLGVSSEIKRSMVRDDIVDMIGRKFDQKLI